MRVAFLANLNQWGGTEVHTTELACLLDAKGHQVTIVELDHHYDKPAFATALEGRQSNVRLKRIKMDRPLADLSLPALLRLLWSIRGDLCIFPKGSLYSGNWRLDLAARLVFPRYMTIEHLACDPAPLRSSRRYLWGLLPGLGLWWHAAIMKRRIRSLGPCRIVCVSDAVRRGLSAYHFPAAKMRTIRNGIDTEKFQRSGSMRQSLRAQWNIPADALVFGVIGRFDRQKGFDTAIELFAKLLERHPDRALRLVLAGSGAMHEEIRQAIVDQRLGNRVLLSGFSPRPWEIYSALDIYLMPSRNEGLPFALLEAMACQCVPIAMGVGGVPEVLSDTGMGWLTPPADSATFLEGMDQAVGCAPERLEAMGRQGREHIMANFNASLQYRKIVELIEQENGKGRT